MHVFLQTPDQESSSFSIFLELIILHKFLRGAGLQHHHTHHLDCANYNYPTTYYFAWLGNNCDGKIPLCSNWNYSNSFCSEHKMSAPSLSTCSPWPEHSCIEWSHLWQFKDQNYNLFYVKFSSGQINPFPLIPIQCSMMESCL